MCFVCVCVFPQRLWAGPSTKEVENVTCRILCEHDGGFYIYIFACVNLV